MASTISAGTSAGTAIAIAGDTSGNLAFTTQAGTYTQTVPNATGTVMVSGNMPAFSASASSAQSFSNNTQTKVQCDTKDFDTANCYDATTNYRFTPNVAGYYQVNAAAGISGTSANGYVQCSIYKNGSKYKAGYGTYQSTTSTGGSTVNTVVYLNGSTDYVEFYLRQNTGAAQPLFGVSDNYFSACLVRGA
jgi:hypothetical protein